MKPYFPKEVSKKFLLVNLVNDVNKLAEDQDVVLGRVSHVAANMDLSFLKKDDRLYGGVRFRKLFASIDNKTMTYALNYLHHHEDYKDLIRTVAEEKGIALDLVEKDYLIMHCLYSFAQQNYAPL